MAGRKNRESFGAIRKLPSGRYQASYVGPDRQRRTAPSTFENITPARVWLASEQAKIAGGTWIAPEEAEATRQSAKAARKAREVLFSTFAEEWLSKRYTKGGRPLRATTVTEYRRLLNVPLAKFGPMPVGTITRTVVKDWHASQLANGTITQTARAYALLSSVLRDAVERHLLDANPCTIKGAASTSSEKPVTPPTEAELAIILSSLSEPYRSLVLVTAWSGLRYGEITELRGGDVQVDGDRITLHISRGVTHSTDTGPVVGPPKTKAGRRSVILPRFVTEAILSRLRGPDDLLWHSPTSPDRHLRQSTLNKHWDPARRAAGRPDLPFHALRHYGASVFAEAGATEAEIMKRLGQKSPGISRRYVHAMGREGDLVDRLG